MDGETYSARNLDVVVDRQRYAIGSAILFESSLGGGHQGHKGDDVELHIGRLDRITEEWIVDDLQLNI